MFQKAELSIELVKKIIRLQKIVSTAPNGWIHLLNEQKRTEYYTLMQEKEELLVYLNNIIELDGDI